MTARRRFLFYVATALAAVGVFAGDAVQAGKPPSLKLTVSVSPTTILEGRTATGKVTHNNASFNAPVTVTLKSSDTTEATVAATVTIPAGTNTVNFTVMAINDNIADGSQPVTITTAATGYASGSTNVTVTDPPPVTYGLKTFAMPNDYVGGTMDVQEMNNLGEVVGRYYLPDGTQQPFYFDALSGNTVATNLNDMTIDPAWPLPEGGWYIFAALGINDLGDIVGSLALPGLPNMRRGFVLELRPDLLGTTQMPRLHVIPDAAWSRTYARRINNAGDVLGVCDSVTAYSYHPALHGMPGDSDVRVLPFSCWGWDTVMNNSAYGTQVVTWSSSINGFVRYKLGDVSPELLNLPSSVGNVSGLSDSGSFCGSSYARNRNTPYYNDGTMHYLTTVGTDSGRDINSSNDVLTEGGSASKPILVHSTHGPLDLSKIVVGSNATEQSFWAGATTSWSKMTERGIAGTDPSVAAFPAVTGSVRTGTLIASYNWAYVLLPIPVPVP